ncbi:MAG: hypothetical protein KDE58_42035, partial [Caldilineaceae bacterium]|nr:hypothetical protein [Caldilineaceae bacterium]
HWARPHQRRLPLTARGWTGCWQCVAGRHFEFSILQAIAAAAEQELLEQFNELKLLFASSAVVLRKCRKSSMS